MRASSSARNGGPGQTTSVFIRGAESNHTLVLVDGVRINPGTIGLAALQNILPSMIERIEVVKGPRSALYGTDAIGGVINVITRRNADDGWSVEAGYGDYDTRQASLAGGFGTERVELDFGLAWLDSDGFPTRTDDTDRGFENLSASAQLRADVGTAEVALRHWRAEGTSEYSDFFLTPVDQDYETVDQYRLGGVAGDGLRPRRGPGLAARGPYPPEPVGGLPAHETGLGGRAGGLAHRGPACARRAVRCTRASARPASRSATRCRPTRAS